MISDEESKGITRDRIVIGGFSQGGSVALYSAFSVAKPPVAGILGLSTWMPLHHRFPGVSIMPLMPFLSVETTWPHHMILLLQIVKANQETPVLLCHGRADPMVTFGFGELTSRLVQAFNSKADFRGYDNMGHSSSEEVGQSWCLIFSSCHSDWVLLGMYICESVVS